VTGYREGMSRDAPEASPYRLLPSVDETLRDPAVAACAREVGYELLASFVASIIEDWRSLIRSGELDASQLAARLEAGELNEEIQRRVREERGRGVTRAVNATGVVLHTGLGRAPVHPEVAAAMAAAARGYCVLEVDRFSGERNQRDERLSELLRRLVGSPAAIAVNNNAGAAFLAMHTFAAGREAIVSRGELVEIGGSFRVPDVMRAAGVKLVEVGSTNRTRAEDYRRAIGGDTGLLMKVHTSNFALVGFTEEVGVAELAALGREHDIPTAFDLGSGLIEVEGTRPLDVLGGETRVRDAVEGGIEIVTFSGDKLVGAPQAGFVVGTPERVEAMRRNPLYRALRLDKVALAGLERTLELLLAGRGDEIPTRRMLLAPADEMREAALALAAELDAIEGLVAEARPDQSEPGSGSAPGEYLETYVVAVTSSRLSPQRLADRLRAADPPVFGRIQGDILLLDPRTLLEGDREGLLAVFAAVSR